MVTATNAFIDSLEKWLEAIHEDDFARARHHAEHLLMAGELLVIHPEFTRCFGQQCPNVETKEALLHLCQVLVCATDMRARVLQWSIEETRPMDQFDGEGS